MRADSAPMPRAAPVISTTLPETLCGIEQIPPEKNSITGKQQLITGK
jgi:hypothetical protein